VKKYIKDLKVGKNIVLGDDYYLLELDSETHLPEILPGQFVEIAIDHSPKTFLRRPFSVHDVDYSNNTISLFIKKLGAGSKKLGEVVPGTKLNIIYPLGNHFTYKNVSNPLLVGGGIGIAPMLILARYMKENDIKPVVLIGGRTAKDILQVDAIGRFAEVYITTEDGSLGEKGLVTSHSCFDTGQYDIIQTCGPEPMMRAVATIAKKKKIPCEVSLENTMACGFGSCLCCVTETTEGNKCVCTEGPVFNSKKLKW
jgi:dihydroorotate dehydrogenase electron transfer subunit